MENLTVQEISLLEYDEIDFPKDTFIVVNENSILIKSDEFDRIYNLPIRHLEHVALRQTGHYPQIVSKDLTLKVFQISEERWLYVLYGVYEWDRYKCTGRDDDDIQEETISFNIISKKNLDDDLWSLIKYVYLKPPLMQMYNDMAEILRRRVLQAYEKGDVELF